MKTLIIVTLALVAFACVSGRPTDEEFAAKKDEMREKWKAMSEDERLEAIKRMHEKFEKIHEKYESLTPEERQKMREHIHEKPVPVRKQISELTDEQIEKIHLAIDKDHKMTDEEVIEAYKKIQAIRHGDRYHRFSEDKRQQHREKFESLSPEEQAELKDEVQRPRFPDGAQAYGDGEPIRNIHHKLSEEEKKKIIEKFEKMTPEEREEIRKIHKIHSRLPSKVDPVPVPVPAAADDDEEVVEVDFEKIRDRVDDIMISEDLVVVVAVIDKEPEVAVEKVEEIAFDKEPEVVAEKVEEPEVIAVEKVEEVAVEKEPEVAVQKQSESEEKI